ncbi:DUF3892 domain-containing protein [Pseudomonas nabeulensis]|uniref:DUF3892 domain-containing protein n=1 Tax=Pseudomonas nabeulensis TaxID=2293833 RepID=A0A4Z0BC26_9PSED|nr:DUF3892 domain-containing protein [Pseudomonas nabeulensis]
MPEYWIVKVHYADDHSRIESLLIRRHNLAEEKLVGPYMETSREFVADLIKADAAVFITTSRNADGTKWARGEVVHAVGKDFISTNRNDKTKDNLGELPEFKPR